MLVGRQSVEAKEVAVRAAALIVLAIVAVAALAYLGVIGGYVALLGVVAIILIAAWQFDRGRRLGARDPFVDANRADFPANAGSSIRQVPTEAVSTPSDHQLPG
jgi:hypothetical protein